MLGPWMTKGPSPAALRFLAYKFGLRLTPCSPDSQPLNPESPHQHPGVSCLQMAQRELANLLNLLSQFLSSTPFNISIYLIVYILWKVLTHSIWHLLDSKKNPIRVGFSIMTVLWLLCLRYEIKWNELWMGMAFKRQSTYLQCVKILLLCSCILAFNSREWEDRKFLLIYWLIFAPLIMNMEQCCQQTLLLLCYSCISWFVNENRLSWQGSLPVRHF